MDGKKILILIVDDNEVILRTLSMKLKASGYDVATAIDGSQALAFVRRQQPDLILLDISFPPDVAHGGGVSWDGFRMIQWFKRMDELKDTPIIIMTGGEAAKFKDRALASGAVDFFHKPIVVEDLVVAIRRILGQPSPETSAPA
jgi:CheY-like chemotaxis protein